MVAENGRFSEERERGVVYGWAQKALPTGNQTTAAASWRAVGGHTRGRFGASLGFVAPGPSTSPVLAVGSPRAAGPNNIEMVGFVDLITGH